MFKILIGQIDNEENDIYVMIDKKADICQFNDITLKKSNLYFLEKRVDIKWGAFSLVEAEIELFRNATSKYRYEYYHLVSGQDLLIKPVSELNRFVNNNNGHEFLGLGNTEQGRKIAQLRMRYYHFVPPHLSRSNNILIKSLFWVPLFIQKLLGVKRVFPKDLFISCNWCSISHSFVTKILSEENNIRKTFKYTVAADEMYKPYVAMKYNILDKCDEQKDGHTDILRKIDWKRGNPYTWTEKDYKELIESDQFIARKFNMNDIKLIESIIIHTIST